MTTEIASAFGDVKRQMNELGQRIDNLYAMKHQENADKIEEITPYTETKTAYIEDTEVTFTDVPTGNLSVYMQDNEGNYPDFTVERSGDRITVSFEALEQITTVTISVL